MSILPQAIGTALAVGNSLIAGGGLVQAPGQGAGQFPVLLGSVTLQGFEVPDAAPWGGDQALTVHKLIGGARVIDAMGIDDRAITIRGTFLSPDADQRALQVDVMRKAGQPVQLAWYSHVYTVVIRSFQPVFQRPDRVPYTLTVEILQDSTQPAGTVDPSDNDLFAGAVGSIGTSVANLTAAIGIPTAAASFSTAAAALASVNAAIGLAKSFEPAAALGVPVAISGLQGAVGSMIASVAGGVGGPILSVITGALAIGGSVSASSAGALGTMATTIAQGRAIAAPVLGFGDLYLSNLQAVGGVVAGNAPAVSAASLATVATMAAALPSLRQLDANLGTMQQIINRAGS